jgi:hypothetical protein
MDFIYSLWKAASPSQSEKGAFLLLHLRVGTPSVNAPLTFFFFFFELQVGHAGTLDPMATGLLIVCVGKATKLVER